MYEVRTVAIGDTITAEQIDLLFVVEAPGDSRNVGRGRGFDLAFAKLL